MFNSNVFTRFFILFIIIYLGACTEKKDEIVPIAPSNLVASIISISQIDLSWTDNSTNDTGFKIERKSGTSAYSMVATVGEDSNTYSDNTEYTYRVYSYNEAGNSLTYSNEVIATTLKIESLAILSTSTPLEITPYSAISGGNISFDGNTPITVVGVVWSTSPNPTIALTTKTSDSNALIFASNITNLNWDTKYFLRSYATNGTGTAYGNEVNFTTSKVEITINSITEISSTTAFCSGTISDNAGESIESKGIVWDTSPNPTIALSTRNSEGNEVGSFESSLNSLNPNTTYYVRAYATNLYDTYYGNEMIFSTLEVSLIVQQRLDSGETPLEIYASNNDLLDSLYGKTYQGGLIFYFDTSTGTGLLTTPNDLGHVVWGCYGTTINGADGAGIGSGLQNTIDIVNGCLESSYAAKLCNELSLNGYSDWYLPSKDELNELWLHATVIANSGDPFVNGVGYWSSTEINSNLALAQDLSSGYQVSTGNGKTDLYYVRAVRTF